MWRSLFFAIGIVLVVLGIESMMVGRFTISTEARLPQWFSGMLAERQDPHSFGNAYQGNSGLNTSQSPFGSSRMGSPSRMGQAKFGNDQFNPNPTSAFSNMAWQNGSTRGSRFRLAGFGPSALQPTAKQEVSVLMTQDWMPWSLMAIGTLVILYTKNLGHREYGNQSD